MGRITVSIPDDLESLVDQYAREHQQPVSHVVAAALSAFLSAGPPPPPPDDSRMQALEDYVALLGIQVEGIRRHFEEADLWERDRPAGGYNQPLPQALPRPPWRRLEGHSEDDASQPSV